MRYTRTPLTNEKPFDLAKLLAYLRLDGLEEADTVANLGHVAAAEIEAYCDIALLHQTITATTDQWPRETILLPCGPLAESVPVQVSVIELDGTLTPVTTGWWVEGGLSPRIHFNSTPGAPLRLVYCAGFGEDAESVPQILAHALHDHALRLFDRRGDEDLKPGLSAAASRILARFKRVKA